MIYGKPLTWLIIYQAEIMWHCSIFQKKKRWCVKPCYFLKYLIYSVDNQIQISPKVHLFKNLYYSRASHYPSTLLLQLKFVYILPKQFWFCKCTTPWMFPPLDILLEYWIEHVTFGLLYVMFTFPTRIFYRGIPGFATVCPCGVWSRGLTTCLLYVGPNFGNLV